MKVSPSGIKMPVSFVRGAGPWDMILAELERTDILTLSLASTGRRCLHVATAKIKGWLLHHLLFCLTYKLSALNLLWSEVWLGHFL